MTKATATTLLLLLLTPLAAATELDRAPVPGGILEYETRGDGEPVLLIHGVLIADAFLPLMNEAVLADYQLIRYRRRGYAGSAPAGGVPEENIATAAADAVALLEHLGLERAHIVGHSAGGVIALQLALDAPERVHSLVLLEPALLNISDGPAFGEKVEPALDQYQAGNPRAAVGGFLNVVMDTEWWPTRAEAAVPGAVKQAERDAATFFELEGPALSQWDPDPAAIEAFSEPTLYVLGSDSSAATGIDGFWEDGLELLRSWLPHTEDRLVEGVHHALQTQDPESVAAAIAEFIARHPL
jgi:pimeloyl-ACP methyl ester carboxylesterase